MFLFALKFRFDKKKDLKIKSYDIINVMKFINKFYNSLVFCLPQVRTKFLLVLSAGFAILYHLVFLVIFRFENVMPLYYYNYFSVSLFVVMLLIVLKKNSLPFSLFVVSMAEVIVHSLMCYFFLGYTSSFHYIILVIGFLPFLVYREHINLAIFFGFLDILIFAAIEIAGRNVNSIVEFSESALVAVRIINITCTVIVIFFMNVFFALLVHRNEINLETEVARQTEALRSQNLQILRMQDRTITSMASLVENRDFDTGGHIQRTSDYAEIIAKNLMERNLFSDSIDENYVKMIKKAAPLHDIGKILVPDDILKKPGKLTDEEFNTMKKHSSEGERIIHDVFGYENDSYVQMAGDIAKSHHEWWNGNGYPLHLSEDEIPLSARIMAIADVFDALVSKRCYKSEIPFEKALEIIEEESGTHFDATIVKIFLESKDEIYQAMKKPVSSL